MDARGPGGSGHEAPGRTGSRYARWAQAPHRERTRIATTALVGPVFLGLLPIVVVRLAPRLDRRLGLRPARPAAPFRVLGAVLAAVGFGLGFWSVETQLDRGRGTPLPVVPTQELLTDGPFGVCRNPMTLGAILAYLGLAVAARTPAGMALVAVMAAALLAYLKGLEEGELEERFGEPYRAYRQSTPFIIPRLRRDVR